MSNRLPLQNIYGYHAQYNRLMILMEIIIKYVKQQTYCSYGVNALSLSNALIKDESVINSTIPQNPAAMVFILFIIWILGYVSQFYCGYPLRSSVDPITFNIPNTVPSIRR